jgi:hypothetical protein
MPQREVLGRHLNPRAEQGDERPQKESNQAEHAERIRGENEFRGGRPLGRRNLNRLRHLCPHADTLWDSGEAQEVSRSCGARCGGVWRPS